MVEEQECKKGCGLGFKTRILGRTVDCCDGGDDDDDDDDEY